MSSHNMRKAPSLRTSQYAAEYLNPQSMSGDGLLRADVRLFEKEDFDAEGYVQQKCQSFSEKKLRQLCVELSDHKKNSAFEMQRSVFSNYKEFIRAAREVSDFEGELRLFNKLMNEQFQGLRGLVDKEAYVGGDSWHQQADYGEEDPEGILNFEQRLQELPDLLDVALAERQVDSALRLLELGDTLLQSDKLDADSAAYLAEEVGRRRLELTEHLAEVVMQPSVRTAELRESLIALDKLGDGARAHTLMLTSHTERMRIQASPMKPASQSYGGAYTATLTQMVFSTISQAAQDSVAVFGTQAAYSSQLLLWATSETEWCAGLLRRHVLLSATATGGLRSAAECVQIALGHCRLLEEEGLTLGPVLLRLVKAFIEQSLESNTRRILESVTAMTVADDWIVPPMQLTGPANQAQRQGGGATAHRFSSSAMRLYLLVQEFLEDVVPVAEMQLTTSTLDCLLHLYEEYIELLKKALIPELVWDEEEGGINVKRAEDDKQQLTLLANAAGLAEELPRLAQKLFLPVGGVVAAPEGLRSLGRAEGRRDGRPDQREIAIRMQMQPWRKQLSKSADVLRTYLCSQKATDLLYPNEEAEDPVLPLLYFTLDEEEGIEEMWRQNPMPSQPMQDFFWTALTISRSASEVLLGRDRMVLQLLTEFALALLKAVCQAELWEDRQYFVGPIGLQQFLLDMHFLKEVSSRYHYNSRQLQQVADDSMENAKKAFNTDDDPLDPARFQEMARYSISKLLHQDGEAGEEQSPVSYIGSGAESEEAEGLQEHFRVNSFRTFERS